MNESRARALLVAVPVWVWLAAIVVISCAIRIVISRRSPAPWIFDDELIYGRLAESLGSTGSFALRGVHGRFGFGPGYPLLISPAYALFTDTAHAYAVAKAINSLLMSFAAVPAYLIARRVLGRPLAIAAAVLAVVIPSMAYTTVIMTENAFYPAFLLCALAFLCVLERPTLARQGAALAAILLAYAIRAQAVALIAALVTALVAWSVLDARASESRLGVRSLLRRLDAFRATWLALAVGLGLAVAAQTARGKPLGSLLGAYSYVTGWHYSVSRLARWFLWHLAELDLYLGILPFAALLVVCAAACRRDSDRALRAFAAVSASLTVLFALSAATLASQTELIDGIGRIEERNSFYAAPLLLIALLVWVERRLGRLRLTTLVAAAVAAALPAVIPYPRFVNLSALSDTLVFIPLSRLVLTGHVALGHVRLLVVVGSVIAGVVFFLLPRRAALLAPVVVLAWLLVWQTSLNRQIRQTSRGVLALSITVRREWVDDAAGPRAHVSAIWTGNASALSLKESEFFNRSIDRVYSLATAPPLNISLATVPSTVGTHGSLVDAGGRPLPAGLFLTDSSAPLGGTLLASDPGTGLRLYRSARAPRLASFLQGRFADGWTGPELTYTLYRCHPARVLLVFGRYPGLVRGPQTVVARVNGRMVSRVVLAPSRKSGAVAASVRPDADGRCEVDYDISPTATPISVLGVPDTRALGVHVDLLRVSPHAPT